MSVPRINSRPTRINSRDIKNATIERQNSIINKPTRQYKKWNIKYETLSKTKGEEAIASLWLNKTSPCYL